MPQILYAFSQKLHEVSPTTGSQPLGFGVEVVCHMRPRESDAQEEEQAILIGKSISEFLLSYSA